MPITPKSHDFIEGYIFSEAESSLIGAIHRKEQRWNRTITIPKSWFGLRATQNELVMLTEHEQSKLRIEIKDILSQMNTDLRSYDYTVLFRPYKQYIRVDIEGVYVDSVKEMTIEQIEKELGYRVKIVADKITYDVYCPNRVCGCCTICDNRKCDHPVPNCKGFAYKPLSRS